jgi:hypothetical protein
VVRTPLAQALPVRVRYSEQVPVLA